MRNAEIWNLEGEFATTDGRLGRGLEVLHWAANVVTNGMYVQRTHQIAGTLESKIGSLLLPTRDFNNLKSAASLRRHSIASSDPKKQNWPHDRAENCWSGH